MHIVLLNIPEACPDCGETDIVDAGRGREHTMGGVWERIEFRCGYKAEYQPNMRQTERRHPCARSQETRAMIEKRRKAKAQIIAAIKAVDADDEFRKRGIRALETWWAD